jgi:hypothetical protein
VARLFSVCDWEGESAASAAERISAGGEQNPSGPSALPLSALTKAKAISCSSLAWRPHAHHIQVPPNVMSDSADYSSSINVLREYFDPTRT